MDDTAQLQALLDKGGNILLPRRTYWVDAVKRLYPRSGSSIDLNGSTIRAIPNGKPHYQIFYLGNVDAVTIYNGKIQGDRYQHTPTGDEYDQWGMCIRADSCTRLVFAKLEIEDAWGDGIYITNCRDVAIASNKIINNRRNNITIIYGSDIRIAKNAICRVHGTRPEAGIDLEPDPKDKDETLSNIAIVDNIFIDNARTGVLMNTKRGKWKNVKVTNNRFIGSVPLMVSGQYESLAKIHWWMKILGWFNCYRFHPKNVVIK